MLRDKEDIFHALRTDYGAFLLAMYPKYEYEYFQQKIIAPALNEVVKKNPEYEHLDFFMPFRHGKSMGITVPFPPFYLGHHPEHTVMVIGYNARHAWRLGQKTRDLMETPLYEQIFPDASLRRDSRARDDFTTKAGGRYLTGGFDGTINGSGADCLPAGTRITTRNGDIDIADLCRLKYRPEVLSYDHERQSVVWRRIAAVRTSRVGELVGVTTRSGRTIFATPRHRFYVRERGYRKASRLRPGDRFVTAEIEDQYPVRPVRCKEGRSGTNVQGLLQQGASSGDRSRMFVLPCPNPEAVVRVQESNSEWDDAGVLFDGMPSEASGRFAAAAYSAVPRMREAQAVRSDVLLSGMSPDGEESDEATPCLSAMSERVYSPESAHPILQPSMRGSRSRRQNAWAKQFALQGRQQLLPIVQEDVEIGSCQGSPAVRCVPREGQHRLHPLSKWSFACTDNTPCASHRRESAKQRSAQSRDAVQDLSRHSPQVGDDTVAAVGRIYAEGVCVYDIQVEGTHNFFADGLLVHNCILIDDPIKSPQEATSEATEAYQRALYTSIIDTRLEPGGTIMFVTTRWTPSDLAGWRIAEDGGWDAIRNRPWSDEQALAEDEAGVA